MDPSNTQALSPPAQQTLPVGDVDFNKPIEVFNRWGNGSEDQAIDNGKIIGNLRGNAHPVVVSFTEDGTEMVDTFDTDGDSASGDYVVKNLTAPLTYPVTVYGVLVREDDRKLSFVEDVYHTQDSANEASGVDDIVFPLTINAPINAVEEVRLGDDEAIEAMGHFAAPTVLSDAEKALAESGQDTDELSIVEDDEESDDTYAVEDSAGPIIEVTPAVAAPIVPAISSEIAPGCIATAYCSSVGRNLKAGDQVRAYRNGYGWREVTVEKVRSQHGKNFYVRAEDGSAPYWANNKNIGNRVDAERPTPMNAAIAEVRQVDEAVASREPVPAPRRSILWPFFN